MRAALSADEPKACLFRRDATVSVLTLDKTSRSCRNPALNTYVRHQQVSLEIPNARFEWEENQA